MNFDPSISVSTVITLISFLIGGIWVWNNVRGQVVSNTAKLKDVSDAHGALHARCTLLDRELSDFKTHVAETYISKQGSRESTDQIMTAIHAIKASVDGTNQRIDRLYEPKTARTTQR